MENKLKCLIVDDENPAHFVIKSHIERSEDLIFLDSAFNGKEAIIKINSSSFDIVFMDIDMPFFTGIEVLQTLPIRPATIITTAYNNFAFDAYQLDAVDYLLKPISFPRFMKSVEKAKAFLSLKSQKKVIQKTINFKVDGYEQTYNLDEISHFESLGNYLKVHFTNAQKPKIVYESLKNLIENLPSERFIQIHKSFIINILQTKSISKEQISLANNTVLPLGRKYELLATKALKNL